MNMVKELKIDFDNVSTQNGLRLRLKRLVWVINFLQLKVGDIPVFPSSSGKGYHVIVKLKENIPDIVAVAIQSLAGSDYKRESFNLLRVLSKKFKNSEWNVLFKRKIRIDKYGKLHRMDKINNM